MPDTQAPISQLTTIGARLTAAMDRKYGRRRGVKEVAKARDVHEITITRWRRDMRTPSREDTEWLAGYLGVSWLWLERGVGDMLGASSSEPGPIDTLKLHVPLWREGSTSPSGAGLHLTLAETDTATRSSAVTALLIVGLAMAPVLMPGDTVLIDGEISDPRDLDGQLAGIILPETGATVRRLKVERNGTVHAIPANPQFAEDCFTLKKRPTILGKAFRRMSEL